MSNRELDWIRGIELWESGGAVTNFMRDEFPNLRDSNGEPLPQIVRDFLKDLLWCNRKPRKGRPLNKTDIREQYRRQIEYERFCQLISENADDSSAKLRGQKTIREKVIADIARAWNVSPATIDAIVYPRKKQNPS